MSHTQVSFDSLVRCTLQAYFMISNNIMYIGGTLHSYLYDYYIL